MNKINNIYYERFTMPDEIGQRVVVSNGFGKLYNSAFETTEETIDSLPSGYTRCFNGEIGGYVRTEGIKALKYIPDEIKTNVKDLNNDKLYISYMNNKVGTKNYDVVVFGKEILSVLYGAYKDSGYDISEILIEMFDSEKLTTSEKFVRIFDLLYASVEPSYNDKVFLSHDFARLLPEKEDTVFEYRVLPDFGDDCVFPSVDSYMDDDIDAYLEEYGWHLVSMW